ncbi:MAG: hypothetical protein HY301_18795, partial [Verrucomicrobia bacterium]|nr:hypothetical protein [Verrucomicrobiota bacterium]
MRRHFLICLLSLGLAVTVARGSTSLPLTLAEQYAAAAAICRGTVRQVESFADSGTGLIRTRAMIEVHEVIKGFFPVVVQVVHNGGTVGNVIVVDGFGPRFRAGEDRLLFLGRAEDGTLFSLQGGATAIALKPLADTSTPPGKDAPLIPSQAALLEAVRELAVPTLGAGEDVTDQAGFVTAGAAFSNPPPPGIYLLWQWKVSGNWQDLWGPPTGASWGGASLEKVIPVSEGSFQQAGYYRVRATWDSK